MKRRVHVLTCVVLAASLVLLLCPSGFSVALADTLPANVGGSGENAGAASIAEPLAPSGADDAVGEGTPSGADVECVDDEVLVVYEADATAQEERRIDEVARAKATSATSELSESLDLSDNLGRVVKMQVDEDAADELIDELNATPGVAHAQHNFIYRMSEGLSDEGADIGDVGIANAGTAGTGNESSAAITDSSTTAPDWAIPDDKDLSKQYYLEPWGESTITSGANLYNAWTLARAEQSVSIAVLDTGVLTTHEDLAANIDTTHMANLTKSKGGSVTVSQGTMTMTSGHGSHVAGIVAGVANNNKGIAGTSYNARLVPLQVFYYDSSYGNRPVTDSVMLLAAYQYLKELIDAGELTDLHVINMSLGGYGEDEGDVAFQKAVKTMRDDYNVLTVAAGGNGDDYGKAVTDKSWPADFDECMSVTALEQNGTNATFSDYNEYKDISAPGVDIYSTYNSSEKSYTTLDGTSMATPLVAGIAALLWTVQPELTVPQAFEALENTAHALDPNGANYHDTTQTGSAGAVDAYEAVKYVIDNFGGTANVEDPRPLITDADVTLTGDTTYTGAAVTPTVTVQVDGTILAEGTDYTLEFKNNVEVGTAQVVVTGIDNYRGSVTKSFAVGKADVAWKRLAGGTAIGTMKQIVNEGWDSNDSDWVSAGKYAIVATTAGYYDALSASGLAGLLDCPILMTAPTSLTDTTSALIKSKGVKNVIVVGGTSAVSANTFNQIKKLGVSVERVWGNTAIGTANKIYEYGKKVGSGWGSDAIVATSSSYQDALSIAPYAYQKKAPIFLAKGKPGTLIDTSVKAIKNGGFTRTIITGGTAAVASSVESSQLAGKNCVRLGGNTAYGTSKLVANWCISQGMSANKAGIATGKSYYDALTGAALCGKNNAVLCLIDTGRETCVSGVLAPNKNKMLSAYVFGGTQAVPDSVLTTCKNAVK